MARLVVRLLGRPALERDGVALASPRGRKAWGVLAYTALAERPASRERLAGLLFADAADPLGALRWTLAELRRALHSPDVLRGDPPLLGLPEGTVVDALDLLGPAPDPDLVRGELLEGADPAGDTVFGSWLLVERRRIAGHAEGVLHDAALDALARGDTAAAAALAHRALALSPFDEDLHELLVRCLRRGGDAHGAQEQARACDRLIRSELGRPADARVARAAGEDERAAGGDRAAALAQLRAGRAALEAGAVEPGIACLRLARAEAQALGDPVVLARALAALGSALVHAVRGHDEEGSTLLREAVRLADDAGDRATAAEACREIGYVEAHAGRGGTAGRWLQRATALADSDDERAAVLSVRGMALSDRAHYGAAEQLLRSSAAAAASARNARAEGWALALLGRLLLLRGELAAAAEALDRALTRLEAAAAIDLLPFPETLRAEVLLRNGEAQAAEALVDHAFSLGCRLGDPCWEALSARVTGLVLLAGKEPSRGVGWLRDAVLRAGRVSDRYAWAEAQCLEALAAALVEQERDTEAEEAVRRLEHVAGRGDMRELVVRAQLLRARLGQGTADAASARLLAAAIDNPRLTGDLAAA